MNLYLYPSIMIKGQRRVGITLASDIKQANEQICNHIKSKFYTTGTGISGDENIEAFGVCAFDQFDIQIKPETKLAKFTYITLF